jgi:tetratricopeptide (TPR) repeat protein
VLQEDPENAEALVVLGNALAGLQNFEEAIAANERAIELDPSQPRTRVNLGSLNLMTGNVAEAEEAFRSAVAADPKSVEAHIGLASFLWLGGRVSDAEREFRTAHGLNPADLTANRALAAFYMATGRSEEAEGYLRNLVNRTNTRQARIALSDYYLELGRPKEAVRILEDLKNEAATDDIALELKIARAVKLGGGRIEAARLVDEILNRHPRNPSALAFKAHLLLQSGRWPDALAVAERAVAADARSPQAQFALGVAERATGRLEEARKTFNSVLGMDAYAVGALVELAQIHLARRQIETALGLAEKAVQVSPTDVEPQLVLARVLSSRPEWSGRAAATLRRLAEQYPRSARVRSELARLALSRGDRAGAVRGFEQARALDPLALEPLVELIKFDLAARNLSAAARRLDVALARQPDAVEVLMLAAELHLEANRPVAERHLRRVIELDPANAGAYQMLGDLYLRQGKISEAKAEFKALAASQPKLVEAPTMLGLLAGTEGNLTEAVGWFQQALRINPRTPVAANNLAWIYVERGEQLDVALQLAQIAHSELPQNPEVKDTLGWAYYRKGLVAFAVRTLNDAVMMQPDNPVFHYHLGMAHAANAEDARARAALERALKLNPEFPGALEARQTLQKLLY